MIILYLSYIVLIFSVLKFYKNNSKYAELISTLLIIIGIYIINLLIPIKIKEKFGSSNGRVCTQNWHCNSGHCVTNKCTSKRENGQSCDANDNHDCNTFTPNTSYGMDNGYYGNTKKCVKSKCAKK